MSAAAVVRGEGSTIIPAMRYRDAPAAIEWLCNAFGFEKKLVVPGAGNTIAHAELALGNGMVMIGSVTKDQFGALSKQPDEIGGAETQRPYVIVADVEAHYALAKAAGAKILMELEKKEYGASGYACTDVEGHAWFFGSYSPWDDDALGMSPVAGRRHVRHGFGAIRPYVYGYMDLPKFVKQVFGAEELERVGVENGGAHIELRVSDGVIVLEVSDPPVATGKAGSIYVYVTDVDAAYAKALKFGAASVAEPADKPYDERSAGVRDRFGNTWWVATYRRGRE